MQENAFIWVSFAVSLGVSWLLSGIEAGLFALSRLRVRQQMRAGHPSAKVLHQYLENPENFLWTILVGNTLANFLILGWMVVVLYRVVGNNLVAFVAAYSVVVFVFYTIFDLLPKTLFRSFPNRLCLFFARPFGLIHWLLRPLVAVVESFSALLMRWRGGHTFTGRLFGNREELRLLMKESSLGLTSDERAMIDRVLDFQSLTVRHATRPMAQTITLERNSTVENALAACREHGYTRFPVWGERDGRRRIIGVVSCNAMLYATDTVSGTVALQYLKPAIYLDQDLRLELALRRLQKSGQRIAIVLGREHQEIGIITLQDIIKAIFGEVSL